MRKSEIISKVHIAFHNFIKPIVNFNLDLRIHISFRTYTTINKETSESIIPEHSHFREGRAVEAGVTGGRGVEAAAKTPEGRDTGGLTGDGES